MEQILETILSHHKTFSLFFGFLLDCLLGDPHFLPHPVRFIGAFVAFLEKKLNKSADTQRARILKGLFLVFSVLFLTFFVTFALLFISRGFNPLLFLFFETLICYYSIAARSLRDESMKVFDALKICDLELARKKLSMIVGRDTNALDEEKIAKAAIETVAENTSDGVVAPMLFMAIFGPCGGAVYKAINTMDSMVAYKNERFRDFGYFAAKLDDIANFLPARISAALMILASTLIPKFNGKNALKIFLRDRHKHESPNSAQTESVMAGALGLQLSGDALYNGVVEKKEFIGDEKRKAAARDIVRANTLMYTTTFLSLILSIIICEI